MQKEINAFHTRAFRRILGLDSTYVNANRANTNGKAHAEMKKYNPHSNEITLSSELVREQRIKLASHSLRTSEASQTH